VAVHKGLEHHLVVVFKGQCNGLLELIPVVGLGDAHAGTGVGRLDEDGPAQLGNGTVTHAVQVVLDLPAAGTQPLGVGDTGGIKQSVGHGLVHADGACQHAAAHIGDAGQLQQALHGAVLAPQAVEHRDDDIDMDLFHLAFRGEQDHPVVGAVRAEHTGHVGAKLLPAAVGHLGRAGLGVEPAALFGDADGHELIAGAVDVIHERAGGDAADLVLTGHPAKQDDNAQFIFRLHNESLLNQAGRSCTAAVSCYIRGIDVFIIQYIRAGCKRKTRAGQCGKQHGVKNQKT